MNIEELNTQIEYLKETKNLIKEQLIAKGQPVDDNTTFREYVDNMIDLIDTTDADAIDSDIVENKTAYVNGQKVTGTLEIVDAISIDNSDNTDTNLMLMDISNIPSIVVGADINDLYGVKEVVEDGVGLEIIAPQSQLADVIGLTTDKIKAGETILGVVGSVVELNGETETVTPTTSQQIITPTSPKNALTQVTVNAVTSAIDNNIQASNIKSGVSILGVNGSVIELNGETASVTPTTSQQTIVPTGTGKNALTQVTVDAVTSAIDQNIVASNIKDGVTILGITGTAQTMKTYATQQDMEQALLDGEIDSGDFVLCEYNYTFYIAETNAETGNTDLIRLIREYETISPQDFEEAEEQIGDLFGEEGNE